MKYLFYILRDYIDHHLVEIEKETDPKSSFYKDAGSKLVDIKFILTRTKTFNSKLFY